MSNPVERPLLVFDGDCGFCTTSVRWVERRMRWHPEIRSWQSLELPDLGLTQAQCTEAVQLVEANGSVHAAHIAVARTLIHGGRGWAVMGRIMMLPGIKQLAGWVYRWVARNRHRMPGATAACEIPASTPPETK